jgi:hypothetical protein
MTQLRGFRRTLDAIAAVLGEGEKKHHGPWRRQPMALELLATSAGPSRRRRYAETQAAG